MSFVIPFLIEKKTLESVELTSDDEENEDVVTDVQNPTENEIKCTDTVDVAASLKLGTKMISVLNPQKRQRQERGLKYQYRQHPLY